MSFNEGLQWTTGDYVLSERLNAMIENGEHNRDLMGVINVAIISDAGATRGDSETVEDGESSTSYDRQVSVLGDNISIWIDSDAGAPAYTFTAATHAIGSYGFNTDTNGSAPGPISLGAAPAGGQLRSIIIKSMGPDLTSDAYDEQGGEIHRHEVSFWQTEDMNYLTIDGFIVANVLADTAYAGGPLLNTQMPLWGRTITFLGHRSATSPLT